MQKSFDGCISVAICTRNRSSSLNLTLESLSRMQSLEGASWELLIIDNGSTDSTDAVVANFVKRLPVRRIFEAKPGLSNARNRAVDEACGRYLVWTDDDVTVEPGWLAAYAAAFSEYPDAAIFGGKILPILLPPTPKWFKDELPQLSSLLAYRDFGANPVELDPKIGRVPFGANYAIRMKEQKAIRYDAALGAGSKLGLLGEEGQVICAILNAGAYGRWLPDSVVHHRIGPDRQTVSYVMKYYRSQGATAGHLDSLSEINLYFGLPRWLIKRLAARFLLYRFQRAVMPPRVWVKSLIDYAFSLGQAEYWRSIYQIRIENN